MFEPSKASQLSLGSIGSGDFMHGKLRDSFTRGDEVDEDEVQRRELQDDI